MKFGLNETFGNPPPLIHDFLGRPCRVFLPSYCNPIHAHKETERIEWDLYLPHPFESSTANVERER